eukprot:282839_1
MILKKKFIKKLKKLKCNNILCNVINYKQKRVKACNGCGNTVYCSNKCQKIHWKYEHSQKCDHLWEREYCSWMCDLAPQKNAKTERTISFDVEYDDYISGIYLGNPTKGINKLMNSNDIIAGKRIILKISYCLRKTYLFEIKRSKPITRKEFGSIVCDVYKQIYDEEDETCTIPYKPPNFEDILSGKMAMRGNAIPFQKKTINYISLNRHWTNGKYGIGNHVLGDLTFVFAYDEGHNIYSLALNS